MTKSVKKITAGTVCAVVAAAVICTGTLFTSAKLAEKNSIGSEAAYLVALEDAGVSRDKAYGVESDFEREDGKYIFDVKFHDKDIEYEYKIDAKSGDVISRENEKADVPVTAAPSENTTEAQNQTTESTSEKATEFVTESTTATGNNTDNKLIGEDKAKSIALNDAGVKSSSVKFTKARLDREDNAYDIEFIAGGKKYEYEISARSGKIIDKEVEKVKSDNTNTTGNSSIISVDAAKSKAVAKANLKESEVKFIKAKLDRDDGRQIYEIEFIKGIYEYEVEIDAVSGNVLDYGRGIND